MSRIPYLDRCIPHLGGGAVRVSTLAAELHWDVGSITICAKLDSRFSIFMRDNTWWMSLSPLDAPNPTDTVPNHASNHVPTSSSSNTPPRLAVQGNTVQLTVDLLNPADRQACRDLLATFDEPTMKTTRAKKADPAPIQPIQPMPPPPVAPGATMDNPSGVPGLQPAQTSHVQPTSAPQPPPVTKVQPQLPAATAPNPALNPPNGQQPIQPGQTVPAIGVNDARLVVQEMYKVLDPATTGKEALKDAFRMHGAQQLSQLPAEKIPSFVNHIRRVTQEAQRAQAAAANASQPATAEVDLMG